MVPTHRNKRMGPLTDATGRTVEAIIRRALGRVEGASREAQVTSLLFEASRSDNLEVKHRLLKAARETCPENSDVSDLVNEALDSIADEYVFEAWTALDREMFLEAVNLARRALELDEQNAEAWIFMAENTRISAAQRIELLQRAISAGDARLKRSGLSDSADWGMRGDEPAHYADVNPRAGTHPALRARLTLSLAFREQGDKEAASDLLYELFDLDPDDTVGARFELIRYHLLDGEYTEAEELLELYRNEESVEWAYNNALVKHALHSGSSASRRALNRALNLNPHIATYLLRLEEAPRYTPRHFTESDEYGAVNYVTLYETAWNEADGALDWLRNQYGGAVH